MNKYYAQCILYSYNSIDAIIKQVDKHIEEKAYFSISNFSPAFEQCLGIVKLTEKKDSLLFLKDVTKKILSEFSFSDYIHLEYKFFRKPDKLRYVTIDFKSRCYFRKQNKLIELFSNKLKENGYTDDWFTSNYLIFDFFKNLYRKVIEHERTSLKNPKISRKKREAKIPA